MKVYLFVDSCKLKFKEASDRSTYSKVTGISGYKEITKTELFKDKPFLVISDRKVEYTFRKLQLDLKGNGDLKMAILVHSDEEAPIIDIISNQTTQNKDSIANILTCNNNRFIFLLDLPRSNYPNKPGGLRRNILV